MAKVLTLKQHRELALLVVLAVLVFVWATILKTHHPSQLEYHLFRSINNWPDGLKWIFLPITELGSWIALVVITLFFGLHRKNLLAVRLIFYGAVTLALTLTLKSLIDQPRPVGIFPFVHQRESFAFNSLGFPSSHTATVTVLALLLWPVLPPRYRFLVPIWILAVGVSRIYLGAHTPLDVIAGFCVGLAVVCAGLLIEKSRRSA